MKVTINSVVSLDYTLKNNKGEVLDSSNGRSPLVYLHGVGALIPGLENEINGMEKGQSKLVTVQPEDAYGQRSEDLLHIVPKSGFQGDEEMFVGMQVQLETEQGPAIASISKIEGDDVTLDLNHPLAGEVLTFEISIADVREATADEIAHGHVHGPGGHHH
ncbi:MAG TPA: peptidylprolyl isomerase [Taishania sp.]|nr:peptidylprolyl isomerase [Taishania sp.]